MPHTKAENLVLAMQFVIEHAHSAQEQVRRYGAADEHTLSGLESSLVAFQQGIGETGECISGIGCGCVAPWAMDSNRRPDPLCARCGGTGEVPMHAIRERAMQAMTRSVRGLCSLANAELPIQVRCDRCDTPMKTITSREDSGLSIVGTGHVYGKLGPCGGQARAYDARGHALTP